MTTEQTTDEASVSSATGSLAARVTLGLFFGILWSLPGLYRTAPHSPLAYWLVPLVASATLFPVFLMGDRRGELGSEARQKLDRSVLALTLACALAAPFLLGLAALLARATHHRPLGAVTFAVIGGAIFALALLVVVRLFESRAKSASALYISRIAGAVGATVLLSLVAYGALHSAFARGLWLDVVWALVLLRLSVTHRARTWARNLWVGSNPGPRSPLAPLASVLVIYGVAIAAGLGFGRQVLGRVAEDAPLLLLPVLPGL